MSTGNIIGMETVGSPIPTGINVTFSCNHGREQRTYFYPGTDAALAIAGGADPADFEGTEGGAPNGVGEAIEGAIDIAEIGGLL